VPVFKTTTATSPEAYIAALDEPRRSEIRTLSRGAAESYMTP